MSMPYLFDPVVALARIRGRINGDRDSNHGTHALKSQLSPMSQGCPIIASLTSTQRDNFEERAAIIEYDAGVPRTIAERLALIEIGS